MIDFCETMNPDCIKTKVIDVDTATEYFGYMSLSVKDDNSYNRRL